MLNAELLVNLLKELRHDLVNFAEQWGVEVHDQFKVAELKAKDLLKESFEDIEMPKPDSDPKYAHPNPDQSVLHYGLNGIIEFVSKSEAYLQGLATMSYLQFMKHLTPLMEMHEAFMQSGRINLGYFNHMIEQRQVVDEHSLELIQRLKKLTDDMHVDLDDKDKNALYFLKSSGLLRALRKVRPVIVTDITTYQLIKNEDGTQKYKDGQIVDLTYGVERHALLVEGLERAERYYYEHQADLERQQQMQHLEQQREALEAEYAAHHQSRANELKRRNDQRELEKAGRQQQREANQTQLEESQQAQADVDAKIETVKRLQAAYNMLLQARKHDIDQVQLAEDLGQPVNEIQTPTKSRKNTATPKLIGTDELKKLIVERVFSLNLQIFSEQKQNLQSQAQLKQENANLANQDELAKLQGQLDQKDYELKDNQEEHQKALKEKDIEYQRQLLDQQRQRAEAAVIAEREARHTQEEKSKQNEEQKPKRSGVKRFRHGLWVALRWMFVPWVMVRRRKDKQRITASKARAAYEAHEIPHNNLQMNVAQMLRSLQAKNGVATAAAANLALGADEEPVRSAGLQSR